MDYQTSWLQLWAANSVSFVSLHMLISMFLCIC